MLLTTSEKAKQVRSLMLDIVIAVINEKTGGGSKYINPKSGGFDKIIGSQPIDFDHLLEENKAVLERLKLS